jgi:hypothetical protein
VSAPITLTLPMPPNLGNARMHWRTKLEAKRAYFAELDWRQGATIPDPPGVPFSRCRIRSRMLLGGAMDDDNAMHRHKWVLDWLKTRGYIVDDRKKCLTWEAFPEQIVKRDGKYRIELTLTPLPESPRP